MVAIVTVAGKQYKVSKGDILDVDKIDGKEGETLIFDRVSFVDGKDTLQVVAPVVEGLKVRAKILSHFSGEKVEVRRFKAKVRERRHTGFRKKLTKIEVLSVG